MSKSRRKAAFDFEKLIAGGSAPAPWVHFFVRPKEMDERKGRPDGALSCAPRLWVPGAGPTRHPCRVGQSRASLRATPSGRTPKALRCSGAPYGSQKTNQFGCPARDYGANN